MKIFMNTFNILHFVECLLNLHGLTSFIYKYKNLAAFVPVDLSFICCYYQNHSLSQLYA